MQPLPSDATKTSMFGFLNAEFQQKKKPTETLFVYICGTKILGTQLFETTQMCQGSTCHVVAQHGDISKLNKALLLTWEVCATIAIKTPKKIFRNAVPKNTRQRRQTKKGSICDTKILGTQLLTTQMCRCQGPKVHA